MNFYHFNDHQNKTTPPFCRLAYLNPKWKLILYLKTTFKMSLLKLSLTLMKYTPHLSLIRSTVTICFESPDSWNTNWVLTAWQGKDSGRILSRTGMDGFNFQYNENNSYFCQYFR